MKRIESKINTSSAEFQANAAHNRKVIEEFRELQRKVRDVRPQRDIDRLRSQNKLLVRERLKQLLDPGTPFLEFSSLAANEAYDGEVPGAGCVTGIGIVSGREVVINAGDASVKGGAWYPLTVKKTVRAMDIAIENRLPVVHLCDSAGGFLPLQAELFADKYYAGRIFRNQCILSKMGVQQVAVVLGHCTAGGAYVPGLSDYNVIVRGTGAIFLAGPPLVKAATGEENTVDDLGGCDMHTSVSGVADYPASSEEEAIAIARDIVAQFRRPQKTQIEWQEPEAPFYDPSELYGVIPRDIKQQFDIREVIARLVDGSRFHEYQPNYGKTLICGYAHLWGYKIGILGNNGVLFNDSALKGTHFIELCNQNKTPLLFLQNITGFMVGLEYERRGITKDGAKMIMAVSCSEVPKLTV
ncbi:MAG: acyl-CoA carboxylase subunit beta, partial [Stenotrophobium sp.]